MKMNRLLFVAAACLIVSLAAFHLSDENTGGIAMLCLAGLFALIYVIQWALRGEPQK